MKSRHTYQVAVWGLMIALIAILTFTPFGFIPIGPIKATIVHLPVIFIGMTFGKKSGLLAGTLFAIASLVNNTIAPGILSFAFTPFVEVAGIGGNWMSILICFAPRMILGFLSGVVGDLKLSKFKNGIFALLVSLLHSVMVLGLIYLLFNQQYGQVMHLSGSAIAAAIATTFMSQSIVEAILAALFIYLIDPLINKVRIK